MHALGIILFIIFSTILFVGFLFLFVVSMDAQDKARIKREAEREAKTKQREEQYRQFLREQEAIRLAFEKLAQQRLKQQYRVYHERVTVQKSVVTRGDVRRARELLAKYGGYKAAVKKTHPDYGGNARDFDAVIQAKKLVDRFPHIF